MTDGKDNEDGSPVPVRKVNPLQAELSHQIIELLKRSGLERKSHLTERDLAEQLGVSRSPVRAALKLLEHFKVVTPRSSGGYLLDCDSEDLYRLELELPQPPLDALYVRIGQDRVQGLLPNHVTEADLLRRYDVTKALLSKVLAQLASEGMLQPSQGKGWNFTTLIDSSGSNRESYELRQLIEPAGLRSESFTVDSARLGACAELHHRLVDGLVFEIAPHMLLTVNADFHQMLADFSGNRFFADILRQQNRMRRFTESGAVLYPERMQKSCQEHLDIINCIQQGDRHWAASLMERHLQISSTGELGVPGRE